jgi:hypothetical protein
VFERCPVIAAGVVGIAEQIQPLDRRRVTSFAVEQERADARRHGRLLSERTHAGVLRVDTSCVQTSSRRAVDVLSEYAPTRTIKIAAQPLRL